LCVDKIGGSHFTCLHISSRDGVEIVCSFLPFRLKLQYIILGIFVNWFQGLKTPHFPQGPVLAKCSALQECNSCCWISVTVYLT